MALHDITQLSRLLVGMGGDTQVEVVGEERIKLHAYEPSLGQQCPVLLDGTEKKARCVAFGEDHRLAAQCADLRASNVENVAVASQIG